ncbi:GntR family transcriptional regulator [Tropicimonas sp. TH_r6]|uniref:GntR family transcriptional regulator n=1 Tax=Tropicimonas sp. TH_r6 TaxID=3082085 RepID=UPI002953F0D8|nr:GntR family transcriptional regulator [Tropicimonas sp. TH_r6]MDV7143564.1 GntR family transcriptional regulator [Tropicimonas sp. TH_r6]
MKTSSLPQSIASNLAGRIASGVLEPGAHLSAQKVADEFGVSRSPVREALTLLEDKKILLREKNRGYFVAASARKRSLDIKNGENAEASDDPYLRFAEEWLDDAIPADVTEQMLRDRYDLTKAGVSEILHRASHEGWAERKQGYGWHLLPVAKTPEGFDQVYRFRMVIEPAAILEPSFKASSDVIEGLRAQQLRILESDTSRVPTFNRLEKGTEFHEELIRMSGNPYFHTALVRVNRMRRLMEYRAKIDPDRLAVQCKEHLGILDLIARGELIEASYAMRQHLGGALRKKSPIDWD